MLIFHSYVSLPEGTPFKIYEQFLNLLHVVNHPPTYAIPPGRIATTPLTSIVPRPKWCSEIMGNPWLGSTVLKCT